MVMSLRTCQHGCVGVFFLRLRRICCSFNHAAFPLSCCFFLCFLLIISPHLNRRVC
ncbi:unnamed protein product [Tetraodon nigroviridis]|uniref:(spotted green pufferfish) hypothetical protein n=1 Tax=Tetraodon nigroviridis TaxID=99883 RepID=Q4RT86_TETNG|nr:unnamed protein product [Tetraodon nigroviridis]